MRLETPSKGFNFMMPQLAVNAGVTWVWQEWPTGAAT
jgi:hypothetical protein